MQNFGVVGCGKMGQALLSKIAPELDLPIWCCDISRSSLESVRAILGDRARYTDDLDDVARQCDVVLVAVKPAQAASVISRVSVGGSKCLLSIVAGLSRARLVELAPNCEVVRMMPNTPALVGCGSIVVLDADLRDEMRQLVAKLMSHVGHCHFVSHESMMDAVTGLSGSGPALFAMMIEALADAAVAEGLPRTLAQDLARETMDGTAHLLEVQHPAILKENVMSPGGTTAAGVLAAEKAGFRYAATEFVRAATEKSRNLK